MVLIMLQGWEAASPDFFHVFVLIVFFFQGVIISVMNIFFSSRCSLLRFQGRRIFALLLLLLLTSSRYQGMRAFLLVIIVGMIIIMILRTAGFCQRRKSGKSANLLPRSGGIRGQRGRRGIQRCDFFRDAWNFGGIVVVVVVFDYFCGTSKGIFKGHFRGAACCCWRCRCSCR